MSAVRPKPSPDLPTGLLSRYRWGLFVLALGCAASLLLYQAAMDDNATRASQALDQEAQELIRGVEDGLSSAANRLTALQGLFEASDEVRREEFARFASRIGAAEGLQALGYAPRVDGGDLAEFERDLRAAVPGAHLHEVPREPVTPRSEYFPILYQVRFGAGAGDSMGLVLNSDHALREAILRSIRLDRVLLSGFRSPAEGSERSMLVAPVAEGVVYAAIRIDDFLLAPPDATGARATIRDVTDSPELWIDAGSVRDSSLWKDTLRVDSRRWQVEVARPIPHFARERLQFTLAFLLGIVASTLAALATQLIIDRSTARGELTRLRHLAAEKDRFLASVSHELRTPLTAIVGLSSILAEERSSLSDADIQEMAEAVEQEAIELADLVEDLLTVGRLEARALNIFPKRVDLDEEVARAIERLQLPDGVELEAETELGVVWADPLRVRQIMRNLAVNATKYATTRVEIRAGRSGQTVALEVRNDGLPIPPERSSHIFEPYQGRDPSSSQPSSIGLGLSISRQLARAMQGDISYRHTDGWTTFTVELPASERPVADEAPPVVAAI